MFAIGDKVRCIYDKMHPHPATRALPKVGMVYVVRDVRPPSDTQYIGVLLYELRNPEIYTQVGWIEQAFPANYFVPVIEKKTDISVFTKILDKINNKVPERV